MTSPYLKSPDRLADVIAAIQALGTYRYYKRDFAGWSKRISGTEEKAEHWGAVLGEHPEFFRTDSTGENVSLIIRRQKEKSYDPTSRKNVMTAELDTEHRARLSREPLGIDELQLLVNTAIGLHARALDHKSNQRWWLPLASTLLGGVIGVLATWVAGL